MSFSPSPRCLSPSGRTVSPWGGPPLHFILHLGALGQAVSGSPPAQIALLKILLAAAPTSKAKTDSINILADVLPEEMP